MLFVYTNTGWRKKDPRIDTKNIGRDHHSLYKTVFFFFSSHPIYIEHLYRYI